jgi:precorrin-8X/cobalt-precorrin-8 methylmutase
MHPIMQQSFAQIDREFGDHQFSAAEYAIARRIIHTTADFEFKQLLHFSPDAIQSGMAALRQGVPIVVDVTMVRQGILGMVQQTFQNPIVSAVERAAQSLPGRTRTETGLLNCFANYPEAIYAIGNAPTALLALCEQIASAPIKPALVIGAPVGFISVVESKMALCQTDVAQIRVAGRKGGSPVAAAILNALMVLAWEQQES